MKRESKNRALFEAITNIDEELIAEAAAPKMLTVPKSIRRIAAIAAAVAILFAALALWPADENYVTAAGILKVYACEAEEMEESSPEKFELTDSDDAYRYTYFCYEDRSDLGIPFTFQLDSDIYGDADIKFVLTADKGGFFGSHVNGPQALATWVSTPKLDTVYWAGFDVLFDPPQQYEPYELFHVYVLLYADEHLVGYGILDLMTLPSPQEEVLLCVSTQNFTAYCFPKIDGEYQNVAEEYVWEQIDKYKRSMPKRAERAFGIGNLG